MPPSSSWIDAREVAEVPEQYPFITENERQTALCMPCPKRRREWLMWRAIVREHLGADTQIGYDEVGAPVLYNCAGHISVSHNREYVAVMYSHERCAIDIESLSRDFAKVAQRYITDAERFVAGAGHPLFLAAAWCTKEAVYKYAGRPAAEYLRDIIITNIDWRSMSIIVRTTWQDEITVSLLRRQDSLLAIIGQ